MLAPRRRFLIAAAASAGDLLLLKAAAKAADFQWKLAHELPPSHPLGVSANEMAAAVKRTSNGRLEIQVFPAAQLGNSTSMMTQVRAGAIQMNLMAQGVISNVAPISGLAFVGFALPKAEAAIAAVNGAVGALVRKELGTKGLVALQPTWDAGLRQITTSSRPIRNVSDIAGLKIRIAPAAITAEMYQAFGASTVAVTIDELYTALQTHIADGADGSFINMLAIRQYEVQKYLGVTNHQYAAYWLSINAEAWKSLPPDLQGVVERAAADASRRETRAAELQGVSAADLLRRYGMQIDQADTDSFRARLGGYYARWKREFGPTAWAALEQYAGKLG